MSLLNRLPCRIHRLRDVVVRHSSNSGATYNAANPQSSKSQHRLPAAQMRALISLYHQSDSFITPENLSAKIDEAFFPKEKHVDAEPFSAMPNVVTLMKLVEDRRNAPKMAVWDASGFDGATRTASENFQWSSMDTPRELRVIEALYGVDATHPTQRLPGLEVLEEEAETLAAHIREDLEFADQESFADLILAEKEQLELANAESRRQP